MKRFAVLLLTLALAVCCTLPAFAAWKRAKELIGI